MNFPDHLFPAAWNLMAWLPLLFVWGVSLRRAPWKRFADAAQLNVFAGSVVALMLLWSMKAGVQPGLNFHLVGASVLVLAFGPHLAILGLSLVLAAVTVNGAAAWSSFALNAVVMVVMPVAVAHAVFRLADRFLPNQFFVYIFVSAYLGAALAVLAIGLTATLLLFAAGIYGGEYLLNEYLVYYLLLAFSEAWISGMAMTLMVVYRPGWVSTFDDRRYLLNK
jgi:uncharacterized membrane protein